MSEKKVYRVQIAGKELPIASTEEESYVRSLAQRLDERILKISQTGRGYPLLDAAILCCLNVMDEQVQNVKLLQDMQVQIATQAEQLCDLRATLAQVQNGAPTFWNDGQDSTQLHLVDDEEE